MNAMSISELIALELIRLVKAKVIETKSPSSRVVYKATFICTCTEQANRYVVISIQNYKTIITLIHHTALFGTFTHLYQIHSKSILAHTQDWY